MQINSIKKENKMQLRDSRSQASEYNIGIVWWKRPCLYQHRFITNLNAHLAVEICNHNTNMTHFIKHFRQLHTINVYSTHLYRQ